MQLQDFCFDLPETLIARYPLDKRSASRLMCLNQHNNEVKHSHFYNIINLIDDGDLLVFNDTKVIPAKLIGHKSTGGKAEVLIERIIDSQRVLAQVRVRKNLYPGDFLYFSNEIRLEVLGKCDRFYELCYQDTSQNILSIIESVGEIPLPPYMQRSAEDTDKERYQTIYARHKGSVAAPTAGFHFDEELLGLLRDKHIEMEYLTLHIGAGTFTPVRVNKIQEHKMHTEYLEVSPRLCEQISKTKARGNRVIAVGTTSLRALETASHNGITQPFQGDTNIFIYPGYKFSCVDALITNLHLPGSTLMMLVSAFAGHNKIMHAYHQAVINGYRFYSYGDAMWLEKENCLTAEV